MQLFADMARHASKHMHSNVLAKGTNVASKKRKIDEEVEQVKEDAKHMTFASTLMSAPDTSVSIPLRKKMDLEVVLSAEGGSDYALRIKSKATSDHYVAAFSNIGIYWDEPGSALTCTHTHSFPRTDILPASPREDAKTVELCAFLECDQHRRRW